MVLLSLLFVPHNIGVLRIICHANCFANKIIKSPEKIFHRKLLMST